MRDPIEIDISNVDKYVRDLLGPKAYVNMSKFAPIITPPFDLVNYNYIYKPGVGNFTQHVRVLGSVIEIDKNQNWLEFDHEEINHAEMKLDVSNCDIVFLMDVAGRARGNAFIYGQVACGIDTKTGEFDEFKTAIMPNPYTFDLHQNFDNAVLFICDIVAPVFMANSLMHCKNVELVNKPMSRQQQRLAKRRGEELHTVKTLIIEPFKKQVINEAQVVGESKIKRAFHICRGHYATYTEERPLFGKYAGTFWKSAHVKGRKAAGLVDKDYKIEPYA